MVGPGGRWLPLRCGRRSCAHCDLLAALELGRVVFLDALADPPVGVLVLTTLDPADSRDGERFARSVEQVVKALRRRWPALEYLGFVEFTTGKAATSGGIRRIHEHLLLKGLPEAALPEAEAIARRLWSERTGAWRVTCEPIRTVAALLHYLALHHRKPEQAPPEWWRGRRSRPSRGYYHRPIAELRADARAELAEGRRLWSAMQRLGPDAPAALIEAEVQVMRQADEGHRWEVIRVREAGALVTPVKAPSERRATHEGSRDATE